MGLKGYLRLSGGRKLLSPDGVGTRPTTARVREAVMNLIASRLRGSNWLDLCSGSGVMSCEALQRGVKLVVAVEKNPKVAKLCGTNLLTTKEGLSQQPKVKLVCNEVVRWLNREKHPIGRDGELNIDEKQKFDLVYFDPPYGSNIYLPVLRALLKGEWLEKDAVVVCEYSTEFEMEIPNSWIEIARKHYGDTALVLVSPPLSYRDDIDSTLQRTGPEG